jgi:sugar phosphate isomerase/epimerase
VPGIEKLSINLATVREQWNVCQAVEGCARVGIRAAAPWRDQVAAVGLQRTARVLRDCGMTVTGLCRGGMFPGASEERRRANIDDNLRAIDEAATIGAQRLVLVAGGLPERSKDIPAARAMIEDGIHAVLPHARAANVPLALEPLHPMYAADRCCVNTLRKALDICERAGEGIGIIVDVYHTWWDPEAESQIARAGRKKRLLGFHMSDWLVPTRDLLLDRGMMGDGVIDLPRIRCCVERAGYQGFHEVEIFSAAVWWKRDPEEVLATCVARYRVCC